jgi:hypothetical protein
VALNIARLDRTGTYALPASEVVRVLERWLEPVTSETDGRKQD